MQLDFLQKNCHASHWDHYAWKCIMLRKWEITLQSHSTLSENTCAKASVYSA